MIVSWLFSKLARKSEGALKHERAELRWKLWLRKKAILKGESMQVMLMVGEHVHITQWGLEITFWFAFRFAPSCFIYLQWCTWHDYDDGLGESATWRHDMMQALDLPLHKLGTKSSRVINSGCKYMLIVCASCGYE